MVKKAAALSRIQVEDQLGSFSLLEPFLELYKEQNPGAHYELRRNDITEEFNSLAFVFPYVKNCIEHEYLRRIFGLDVSHMKKISLQGDIIIRPMFLTVVSGRTLDNHMIVCGFAITFAECRDDIDFLNAAMIEAGVVLNDPRNTILSDRGTAEISFLQRSLPLAFEFHCGIHLERNLKSKGWSHWLPLYWKARNAPTIVEHMRCMRYEVNDCNTRVTYIYFYYSVIESSCKPMYEYLSKLNNWQLYQAVDTGHMLYDWKSDNIVEAIFAWCRETRFLNPYMFVKKFLVDILESNNRRKDDIARLQTVLHPQAEQHFHVISHV